MRPLFLAVILPLLACSGAKPECTAIAERCHELATSANATATQKECHENAEGTWTASECVDNLQRCNTACPLESGDGG